MANVWVIEWTDKYYQLDQFSISQLNSYSNPAVDSHGLTIDDSNRIITNARGSELIYRMTGLNNTVDVSFSTNGYSNSGTAGLTIDENSDVWDTGNTTDKAYQWDSSFDGTNLGSFTVPSAPTTNPLGITCDYQNLYITDYDTDTVFAMVGHTSSVDYSFSAPGNNTRGATYDGTNIYLTDDNLDQLHKMVGKTSSVDTTIASPSILPTDLAYESYSERVALPTEDIFPQQIMIM